MRSGEGCQKWTLLPWKSSKGKWLRDIKLRFFRLLGKIVGGLVVRARLVVPVMQQHGSTLSDMCLMACWEVSVETRCIAQPDFLIVQCPVGADVSSDQTWGGILTSTGNIPQLNSCFQEVAWSFVQISMIEKEHAISTLGVWKVRIEPGSLASWDSSCATLGPFRIKKGSERNVYRNQSAYFCTQQKQINSPTHLWYDNI